jgi:hypothetical protein
MANQWLNIGNLMPVSSHDLKADDLTAKFRPGQYSYRIDDFGMRIFQYVKNVSGGAYVAGDLVRRVAVLSITNLDSGTTTSATKSGAFTANKHVGMMCYVLDNADSAGAAPEGEASIIVGNDADTVYLDPDYPLTVALAVNDDLSILSPGWHVQDAAASDLAQNVAGLVVNGIADTYYGFVQCYGMFPQAKLKASTGFTANDGIIAAAKLVDVDANGGAELVIGWAPFTVTSDIVSDKAPMFINTYSPYLKVPTP